MVISKLPRGATEKEEPAVMVTIYGAALETITSDGREVCTTDANGEGVAVLNVGETYTLIGSVSGYEKTVAVASDTTNIKVMPEGAVYWYGNTCGLTYVNNPNTTPTESYTNIGGLIANTQNYSADVPTSKSQAYSLGSSSKIDFSIYTKIAIVANNKKFTNDINVIGEKYFAFGYWKHGGGNIYLGSYACSTTDYFASNGNILLNISAQDDQIIADGIIISSIWIE